MIDTRKHYLVPLHRVGTDFSRADNEEKVLVSIQLVDKNKIRVSEEGYETKWFYVERFETLLWNGYIREETV